MFSCIIKKENVNWFKSVIESISDVMNEINIEYTEKGLTFKNLDRTHIMFAFLELDKKWFKEFNISEKSLNEYSVSKEELYNVFGKHAIQEDVNMDLFEVGILSLDIIVLREPYAHWRYNSFRNGMVYENYQKQKDKTDFWIDTADLNKYLQLLDEDADIEISGAQGMMRLCSKCKDTYKNFSISSFDFEYDKLTPPDLSLFTFVPNFKLFKNIISTFKQGDYDKIYLSLKEGNLNFFGKTDKNSTNLTIQNVRSSKTLEVKAVYSFERICRTVSKLKDVSHMILEFDTDTPIRLKYYKGSGAVFEVLIAPRIEAWE